jgi:positive regulator of sigma E activity
MEQFVRLKQLRIKKEEILLTLGEKKQIRTRSLLYLGIFVILFIGMVTLDPNPNRVDVGNSDNELAAKFLKFLSGKFLVVSMYSGFRVYRANKEIRVLKSEYAEMERKLRYLSN